MGLQPFLACLGLSSKHEKHGQHAVDSAGPALEADAVPDAVPEKPADSEEDAGHQQQVVDGVPKFLQLTSKQEVKQQIIQQEVKLVRPDSCRTGCTTYSSMHECDADAVDDEEDLIFRAVLPDHGRELPVVSLASLSMAFSSLPHAIAVVRVARQDAVRRSPSTAHVAHPASPRSNAGSSLAPAVTATAETAAAAGPPSAATTAALLAAHAPVQRRNSCPASSSVNNKAAAAAVSQAQASEDSTFAVRVPQPQPLQPCWDLDEQEVSETSAERPPVTSSTVVGGRPRRCSSNATSMHERRFSVVDTSEAPCLARLEPMYMNKALQQLLDVHSSEEYSFFMDKQLTRNPMLVMLFENSVQRLLRGKATSVRQYMPAFSGPNSLHAATSPCTFISLQINSCGFLDDDGSISPGLFLWYNAPSNQLELTSQLKRDYMALAHVPSMVCVVAMDGRVLHQNSSSVAYMGFVMGSSSHRDPMHISDPAHNLQRLFALEQDALFDMLEALADNKTWHGLLRMPAVLDLTEPPELQATDSTFTEDIDGLSAYNQNTCSSNSGSSNSSGANISSHSSLMPQVLMNGSSGGGGGSSSSLVQQQVQPQHQNGMINGWATAEQPAANGAQLSIGACRAFSDGLVHDQHHQQQQAALPQLNRLLSGPDARLSGVLALQQHDMMLPGPAGMVCSGSGNLQQWQQQHPQRQLRPLHEEQQLLQHWSTAIPAPPVSTFVASIPRSRRLSIDSSLHQLIQQRQAQQLLLASTAAGGASDRHVAWINSINGSSQAAVAVISRGGATNGGGSLQGPAVPSGIPNSSPVPPVAALPQRVSFDHCPQNISFTATAAVHRGASSSSTSSLLQNSRAMQMLLGPKGGHHGSHHQRRSGHHKAAAGTVPSAFPHRLTASAKQHSLRSEAASSMAAGEGDDGGGDGGERWHQVQASKFTDPVTGEEVIMLIQTDVTARVLAERQLQRVLDAEHVLLEEVFPRQVLEMMTAAAIRKHISCSSGAVGNHSSAAAGSRIKLALKHEQVSIMFADIVSFTAMSKQVAPDVVMTFLNDLYTQFDLLLEEHSVYKVETIGDCYMVAGGLIFTDAQGFKTVLQSQVDPHHAKRTFMYALAMLAAAARVTMPDTGRPVQLRVGIHSGPVVSGVVGAKMPRFCLFGDSVNTASRMESTAPPGRIHISADTCSLIGGDFWEPSGGIPIKGKGLMDTFYYDPGHTAVRDQLAALQAELALQDLEQHQQQQQQQQQQQSQHPAAYHYHH